jgi:hypothetical protein
MLLPASANAKHKHMSTPTKGSWTGVAHVPVIQVGRRFQEHGCALLGLFHAASFVQQQLIVVVHTH